MIQRSLQGRIALTMIALVVLSVSIVTAAFMFRFQASVEELGDRTVQRLSDGLVQELQARANNTVALLSDNLVNPLHQLDIFAIDLLLSSVANRPDVDHVIVYNAEGQIVFTGDQSLSRFGELLDDPQSIAAIAERGKLVSTSGNGTITASMPVWLGDQPLGGVKIVIDATHSWVEIDRAQASLLDLKREGFARQLIIAGAMAFGVIVIGIILATVIANRIVRPIKTLSVMADDVGRKRYDAIVYTDRQDEIGTLERAFDQMANNLRRADEERDALIQRLTESRDAAFVANRAKSEFLATMSHEFRTPLNAILGFSELISTQYFGPVGDDKYRDYAQSVHGSGKHMLALINDVLDISAIEAGKRNFVDTKIDVRQVLEGCVRDIEKTVFAKDIALTVDVPKDLPFLLADERSVIQIFLNLLSNAVKFTDPGGSITVRARSHGRDLVITVRDTGIGIPAEALPNITEPFSQAQSDPHTAREGSGLGLSIVKSLVDAQGGSLGIESEVGEGTAVTVTFHARSLEEPERQ